MSTSQTGIERRRRAPRTTERALVVEEQRVLVRHYDRLNPAVRDAIDRALETLALAPEFHGDDPRTLSVPRSVRAQGERHDMAQLLGRCLQPMTRKDAALARVRAAALPRTYHERLDPDEIIRRGHALADHIEARRRPLTRVLTRYETHLVARDETARTLDLMRSLDENRAYFQRRIGAVASFLPCNQPLYALACFGLVPALMAGRVHVRPPRIMWSFFDQLVEVLDIAELFPNLVVCYQERDLFVAERSAVTRDDTGLRIPVTDAVIFTGTHGNADRVRARFDDNVLFIVNGAGHNPIVVAEGADLSRAVQSALRVQLYNQGQDCASPNAILVHREGHDEFVARLRAALEGVAVGPYRDPRVRVGPLGKRKDLERVQRVLLHNWRWLDPDTPGVIRTRSGIVEPTIVCRPLAQGGNFREHFAPLFFVQRYDADPDLAGYFEDPRYPLHAMYVTVFGHSRYVDGLVDRRFAGRPLHDASTIIRDTDLHAPGVERGTEPYGGFGAGASRLHLAGVTTVKPTLPQRDLFEQLVRPTLADQGQVALAQPAARTDTARPDADALRRALERKFLDPTISPLYPCDTSVEPLIDGAAYLGAVTRMLHRTRGPGDVIYVLAYQFDPDFSGTDDPDAPALGQVLAAKAAAGVDVRIILNGTPLPVNPWRENLAAAQRLRGWRVAASARPPLSGRVRMDLSGATFLGTHHQKVVLIRAGNETVAFVSGMDLVPDHWDHAPHVDHGRKTWPDGSPWGWHDVGVAVRGAAVRGVWDNFRQRWRETGVVERWRGRLRVGHRVASPAPKNSKHSKHSMNSMAPSDPIGPCPPLEPVASAQTVQILRSSFGWLRGSNRELHRGLVRAISAAERYIYVEDQYLCDHWELFGVRLRKAHVPRMARHSLFDVIARRMIECPGLEVIFVGSGKSDPIDISPGPRNHRLTPSLRRLMARLPPWRRHGVAVWRVEDVTVHSKLVLIDDQFAAIGSANFQTRSLVGVDDELQVAYVAWDQSIARLRTAIWAELLGLEPIEEPALMDLDRALGHWHPHWASRGATLPPARNHRLVRVTW